jgi:hypothetical protein
VNRGYSMANLEELRTEWNQYDGNLNVKMAGAILGVAADLSGTIGLFQLGLGALQSLGRQDLQIQDLLNAITAGFAELKALTGAEAKLERMGRVDQAINPALAVFNQLPAIISNPTLTSEYKLEQIQKCLGAVTFLSENEDVWLSVYEETPYYSDQWSGKMAPAAPAVPLVFNHTYTLPQFLRAIHIFLVTIAALDPKSLHAYDVPLSSAAARLQKVHDTIVYEGITGTKPPPNAAAVGRVGLLNAADPPAWTLSGWQSGEPVWGTVGGTPGIVVPPPRWGGLEPVWMTAWASPGIMWPYGAVERFSGSNNVESYDRFLSYRIDPWGPWSQFGGQALVPMDHFLGLVKLRIRVKQRDLYEQLGLVPVRLVINKLRALTGEPQVAPPGFTSITLEEAGEILGVRLAVRAGSDPGQGDPDPGQGDDRQGHDGGRSFRPLHGVSLLRLLITYLEGLPQPLLEGEGVPPFYVRGAYAWAPSSGLPREQYEQYMPPERPPSLARVTSYLLGRNEPGWPTPLPPAVMSTLLV